MVQDEFPDGLGPGTHRGPHQDREVGVDGDGEGPAAGAALTVVNIGTLPRDEVGKAFRRATAIGCGSFGQVIIHG